MKKTVLISILFIFHLYLNAQIKFIKTYGGSGWEAPPICFGKYYGGLVQTKDGGYAISHSTTSYGKWASNTIYSAYFLKLNQYGDTLFSKVYSTKTYSTTHASGMNLIENQDGTFIMGTYFNGAGGGAGVLKLKPNGDTIWSRRITDNLGSFGYGNYITVLKDKGILSHGDLSGTYRGVLAKLDTLGNLVFGKTYKLPGSTSLNFKKSAECANGDLIVIGTLSNFTTEDIIIMKADMNGNIKWAKEYGYSSDSEEPFDIKICSDKSIIITGTTINADDKLFLMKTDSVGNLIYNSEINAFGYGITHTIILDSKDNVYLSGNVAINPTTSRAILMKFDANGNVIWSKIYGATHEYGGTLIRTTDNGFAFCGMRQLISSATQSDLYLVKTDSSGNAGCQTSVPTLTINNVTFTVTNISTINIGSNIISVAAPLEVSGGVAQSNICLTTEISEKEEHSFGIYPNPANSFLNIVLKESESDHSTIQIVDMLGKVVMTKISSDVNSTIIIDQLTSGVYFISISNGTKKQVQKFIKE